MISIYYYSRSLKYINDAASRQCWIYNCDNLWVGRLGCYWVIITIHGAPICFRPDTSPGRLYMIIPHSTAQLFTTFVKLISASWSEASRPDIVCSVQSDPTLAMVRSRWLTQLWLLYLGVSWCWHDVLITKRSMLLILNFLKGTQKLTWKMSGFVLLWKRGMCSVWHKIRDKREKKCSTLILSIFSKVLNCWMLGFQLSMKFNIMSPEYLTPCDWGWLS